MSESTEEQAKIRTACARASAHINFNAELGDDGVMDRGHGKVESSCARSVRFV